MMRTLLVLGSLLCATASAQQAQLPRNDLGFPELQPVTSSSPLSSIFYADRLEFPGTGSIAATITATALNGMQTGTGFQELIEFQLPDTYDGLGPPHALVVAYHGFGGSASTPGTQSTVDEEANARNMAYLSVTGLDDQIFGTAISQQNTAAAIQWMLDGFNIDPDRIYMVGFSMGAGICANFAARHRDPDGLMIAGLGLVSATCDWTMEYNIGDNALKQWMTNPFNFGAPPSTALFAYQSASMLYEDEGSYPPTPGTVVHDASLAYNISNVPVYMTYDLLDTVTNVPDVNEDLAATLAAAGNTVSKTVQMGTVFPPDPNMLAPHSWYVLNETEFFDAMDGVTVDRYPGEFYSRQEAGGRVSFIRTTQRTPGEFVRADANVVLAGNRIFLTNVQNATEVVVDVGQAELTSFPVRVTATSADGDGFRLVLTGFSASPSRMYEMPSKILMTGVDSDPATGSLLVDVAGNSTLDVLIRHDPTWTSVFTTSPNPVIAGNMITADIDGPTTSVLAYLIISLTEQLVPLNNVVITSSPAPPSFIRLLALNPAGDAQFVAPVPNDPLLIGVRFASQALTTTGGLDFESVSNLWGLYVE